MIPEIKREIPEIISSLENRRNLILNLCNQCKPYFLFTKHYIITLKISKRTLINKKRSSM